MADTTWVNDTLRLAVRKYQSGMAIFRSTISASIQRTLGYIR